MGNRTELAGAFVRCSHEFLWLPTPPGRTEVAVPGDRGITSIRVGRVIEPPAGKGSLPDARVRGPISHQARRRGRPSKRVATRPGPATCRGTCRVPKCRAARGLWVPSQQGTVTATRRRRCRTRRGRSGTGCDGGRKASHPVPRDARGRRSPYTMHSGIRLGQAAPVLRREPPQMRFRSMRGGSASGIQLEGSARHVQML